MYGIDLYPIEPINLPELNLQLPIYCDVIKSSQNDYNIEVIESLNTEISLIFVIKPTNDLEIFGEDTTMNVAFPSYYQENLGYGLKCYFKTNVLSNYEQIECWLDSWMLTFGRDLPYTVSGTVGEYIFLRIDGVINKAGSE